DHDLDALETDRPLEAVDHVRNVGFDERFVDPDTTNTSTRRTGPHLSQAGLDGVFMRIIELAATPREELDAVVRHRVVAGRQHHTEIGIAGLGQVGNPGSGQYAESYDVHTGAGQTRHYGSF